MKEIKKKILIPTLGILLAIILLYFVSGNYFEIIMKKINDFIMSKVGWLYGIMTVTTLFLSCSVFLLN